MHTAKTIAEFHFDTVKSGAILLDFLNDANISKAKAAKSIGLSYDALDDSLKGKNKESKMELVVKLCYLTSRTIREWCERMLEGVNDDVAEKVRSVFSLQAAPTLPILEDVVTRCLEVQEHSADHYQATLRAAYEEIRLSKEELRQQYEDEIKHLREENKRLLDALLAKK